jgi:hypothetical protein
MNISRREFRNLLCIMHSIDGWELPATWPEKAQEAFMRDPINFFLRSDDRRTDEIWAIMFRHAEPMSRVREVEFEDIPE